MSVRLLMLKEKLFKSNQELAISLRTCKRLAREVKRLEHQVRALSRLERPTTIKSIRRKRLLVGRIQRLQKASARNSLIASLKIGDSVAATEHDAKDLRAAIVRYRKINGGSFKTDTAMGFLRIRRLS